MNITDLLGMTVAKGASDLHLKVGGFPVLRINGELVPQEHITKITAEEMKELFTEVTTDEQRKAFADELELDFAFQTDGIGRFRINVSQQDGTISLACRPVFSGYYVYIYVMEAGAIPLGNCLSRYFFEDKSYAGCV